MLNGKLEDSAIGIGSVGRDRRRKFISSWNNIFWLEPLKSGALMRLYPYNWTLFKMNNSYYTYHKDYSNKPDPESIYLELS